MARRSEYKHPETTKEYQDAGYTYKEEGVCRGKDCHARIEWWLTRGGKPIPLSTKIVGSITEGNRREILVAHWTDCVNADDFRKPK